MKFLTNLRITDKIIALMIGLVLGFVAIGSTYFFQVQATNAAKQKEVNAFSFQRSLIEAKLLELRLQNTDRQLLDQRSQTLISQTSQINKALQEKIIEFSTQNTAVEFSANLKKANLIAKNYNATLIKKLSLIEGLSLEGGSTVQNDFASSATELENALTVANASDALIAFNSIRGTVEAHFTQNTRSSLEAAAAALSSTNIIASAAIADSELIKLASTIGESIGADTTPETGLALLQDLQDNFLSNALELVSQAQAVFEVHKNLAEIQYEFNISAETLLEQSEVFLTETQRSTTEQTQLSQGIVTMMIFVVAMGAAIGIFLIYRSIVLPLAHMQSVIRRINRGKTKTRVKVLSNDELGTLGKTFNTLFDERINHLESQSKENERLNNSIISLIQALGTIAKKDLTIKVPVSADLTGTISDAVNLLTSETAKTLTQVKGISGKINASSHDLQDQSNLVMQFADSERRQIVATSKALRVLANTMNDVAKQSEQADDSASRAIKNTQSAKQAVGETVKGIRAIRETISETEKRMKRLGERSQEISGIVNLINTIAERTHILALNASMHAASAGEAGRGFAVVADEVQRLAESARQSTEEISAMVNNMRVETSDTASIMNTLISQVADGSKQAEQAGAQMQVTETATQELVETVQSISRQAIQQAAVANKINDRSGIIRRFSEKTEKQLLEQKVVTDKLLEFADALVEQVDAFRLPADLETPPSNVTELKAAV